MQKMLSLLATALVIGGTTIAAAQTSTSSDRGQPAETVGQAPADRQVTPPSPQQGEEEQNTRGADQANKVSRTGVDVTDAPAAIIELEGVDPRSERNFSFDTEKDPAAASDTKN
jgi:hypothetical protein